MAQFNYKEYEASKSTKQSQGGQGQGVKTRFVGEFLKADGDSVVVRFPYRTMDDVEFESTHLVKGVFPGDLYGKRVRCGGEGNCPLCAQGVKTDIRFFAKVIAYNPTENGVELVPCIWDRPAAFADIDIKNLMAEYGDLTENLFKIKRNGNGTATRYTINILMNKTVYNPDIYVKDFSSLASIDAARILTKTVEQYMEAVNPGSTQANVQSVPQQAVPQQPVYEQPVVQPVVPQVPQQPVYQQSVQPQVVQPVQPQYAQQGAYDTTVPTQTVPVQQNTYQQTPAYNPQVGQQPQQEARKRYVF